MGNEDRKIRVEMVTRSFEGKDKKSVLNDSIGKSVEGHDFGNAYLTEVKETEMKGNL